MSKNSTHKKLDSVSSKSKSKKVKSEEEDGPSQAVIDSILNYSKALNVQKSKHLKHIVTLLNQAKRQIELKAGIYVPAFIILLK